MLGRKWSVRRRARRIMNNLTDSEARLYLDDNCTDEEREEIVAAIWREYHKYCFCGRTDIFGRFLRCVGELYYILET